MQGTNIADHHCLQSFENSKGTSMQWNEVVLLSWCICVFILQSSSKFYCSRFHVIIIMKVLIDYRDIHYWLLGLVIMINQRSMHCVKARCGAIFPGPVSATSHRVTADPLHPLGCYTMWFFLVPSLVRLWILFYFTGFHSFWFRFLFHIQF